MHAIKAVLFDLDGTLLPMDNDLFIRHYFGDLVSHFPDIEPGSMARHIMASVEDMAGAPGGPINAEKFKTSFVRRIGRDWTELEPMLTWFYEERFPALGRHFPPNPGARRAYDAARGMGLRIALATNPVFPRRATLARIDWAGFSPEEFEVVTSYEDSCACKPHRAYYDEVLGRMSGLVPADCLMVGNDVREDIAPALAMGMRAFFLSDCPLPLDPGEVSCDGAGSWDELIVYLDGLTA